LTIDYTGFAHPKGKPRSVEKLEKQRSLKAQETRTRKKVDTRDQHRCFWPGCHERAVQKHHQVYRSHGGTWETDNVISGCARHHRWVHDGLIRLIGNPDKPPLEIAVTTLGREVKIRVPKSSG
jgi:hypothetical protein